MCIIVVKNYGINVPDKKTLETCFINNPDGAGFMWNDGCNVYIRKGFMDFDTFYTALKEENKKHNFKNKQLVLHFRIGTGGGNVAKNTHPFAVSKNLQDLEKLETTCQTALAHNGIISAYSRYNRNATTSDTMDYITSFLSLIPAKTLKTTKIWAELAMQANSRFVYMWADNYILSGNGWQHEKGLYFSNSSYKPREIPKYTYLDRDYTTFYKNDKDRLPTLKNIYGTCDLCGSTTGKYNHTFDAYLCTKCEKKELIFEGYDL